jgi:transcriptional regulator with XRE-family HTH domain
MKELIEAMKSKGYTDKTLAEKLGINKSHVSLLRNGKRNPSPELIKKIKAEFPDLASFADVVFLNLVR